jgi:hypothetical protein
MKKLVLFALVGATLVAAGCGTTAGGNSSTGSSSSPKPAKGCGMKASGDCTPHAKANGTVRVDAITWRVQSVKTAKSIGDQEYGLGSKADGVYVVVKLKATSHKDESATLSDNVIKLEVDGNSYDPDNDGSVAAIASGDDPFFLETLNPDTTKSGTVVFDVPKKVVKAKPELRFGELGFGETHAYIALPELS